MNIIDRLNSGELHQAARKRRPDCIDAVGNVHRSPERRAFVDWRAGMDNRYGTNRREWPESVRAELERRYVPAY